MHLRLCLVCGEVGCCDSSPRQHGRRHFEATGHPVIRSYEPGEAWRWCFVDHLTGYQDAGYARRFVQAVEKVTV